MDLSGASEVGSAGVLFEVSAWDTVIGGVVVAVVVGGGGGAASALAPPPLPGDVRAFRTARQITCISVQLQNDLVSH